MNGIIERAKKFAGEVKKNVSDFATPGTPPPGKSLLEMEKKQGAGWGQADIGISGEKGKSSEPAHGSFEHNSPAKPL